MTDKVTATMQIAERIYSLAQEQNDAALTIGAYRALAVTSYFLGDFESARQHAMCGVQIWRSGGLPSPVEELVTPAISCLCIEALTEWHLGEIASCQATMAEAIALAKKLNDMHALAQALYFATVIGQFERNSAEVERYSSDLIELSTRHNFVYWLVAGMVFRGWVRSTSGDTADGMVWIENGVTDYRASGAMLAVPFYLALKAEALQLDAITEAEAMVARTEERWWFAELRQLSGVFLAALGAEEAQIEASFCEAIRIAKEQKSVSLQERAETTYAEYCRQKASGSGGRGFRLPLW
jgi:predicted ATPase